MKLELETIRTDGGTQPRGQINWAVIAEYALDMRDGAAFPPIVVFYDGESYWLADGYHRYYASEQAGQRAVEADVRQGTQQDAQWYSYSANKAHGLRRSNEDKRRAVEAALRHPAGASLSDREIARHCGVDHKTVGAYREKLSGEIPQIEQKTVTRQGSTYQMDTAQIGLRPSEPKPGISPVTFSADGQVATVTVTNGDVAGGLAAVMEAEPAAPKPLKHWTKLENGYAVRPCHLCGETKVKIDPVGDTVTCEACDKTWHTMGEYHTERRIWEDYDTPPIEQQRAAREQVVDNPTYEPKPKSRAILECRHCGGNVLFQAESVTYRCFQCSTEWPSLAEMYAELMEQWRTASRRLEDIRELAKSILVY